MPIYNNPPIIESICEIRFTEDTDWDLTIPGLLFEDIKENYPQKGQRIIQEINFQPDKRKSQFKRQDFAVFSAADKKSSVQVGPRVLLINRFKPYQSWTGFQSQINTAFQKLGSRIKLAGIQRIGLRYVNKIEIKMENEKVSLDKYFEYRPFCGAQLPQSHGDFVIGCVFPFSDKRDLCQVELTSAVPETEGSLAFLLSIDYFLAIPRSIPISQTIEWINNAHNEVERLFEGCISPPLRDLFQEVSG